MIYLVKIDFLLLGYFKLDNSKVVISNLNWKMKIYKGV